jgi:glycerol-3-phosphate acyltransferase PlsX
MPDRIRIALDGMGGDYAPQNIVSGAVQAVSEYDVQILMVGIQDVLESELVKHQLTGNKIEIIDATEVVAMDEHATTAARKKRKSSLRIAVDLASRGEATGIISAGNTGAIYATVKLNIGCLPGVDRLPLAALFPHPEGKSIVLDVGANVDCKPQHLVEFALMGSVYAEEILDIPSPRVGILSIGEEEAKGNDLTKETSQLLKQSKLNFVGNVDAHDIYKGRADVVVCDGFTGNVALKVSESLIETIFQILEPQMDSSLGRILTKHFDYSEYGGAPLLGARVPSFVCHGRSTPKAIKNAIRVAIEFCRHNVNERISSKLKVEARKQSSIIKS